MARPRMEIPALEDDGLPTPEVGDWAEDKYRLVQLYAHLFTSSMRRKWDELAYVDLFAGAGRSRIRGSDRILPASPLLALDLDKRFDRYVFCEKHRRRMEALQQRVRRDYPGVDTRFVSGDVNRKAATILRELPDPRPRRRVLSFCFADPYAVRNLHFGTIEQLAQRYMDFLVLIPSGYDATRNQGLYTEPDKRTIDDFLGNPQWRDEWERAQNESKTFDVFMADAFGRSMEQLDYIYEGVGDSHLIKSTERKLRLYRLAFFSRHPLGARFWSQVRKYALAQRSLF